MASANVDHTFRRIVIAYYVESGIRCWAVYCRSLPYGSGYQYTIPMAKGHRTSNPTRKRGSIGVTLNGISKRRPHLSQDRFYLSCREWNKMLGRVLTLPPSRFGLLADNTDGQRPSDQ
jgi:hypothetical protein